MGELLRRSWRRPLRSAASTSEEALLAPPERYYWCLKGGTSSASEALQGLSEKTLLRREWGSGLSPLVRAEVVPLRHSCALLKVLPLELVG